jgi:hypothetical protein
MASPVAAQETDSVRLAELEKQMEALTRELERLRLGEDVAVVADTSVLGFAPAASKVYRIDRGVSLGGYGEVLYERFAATREDGSASGRTSQVDALRAVLYVGYKFDDQLLFNSEIEIEHAATGQAGSVAMEFAYIDYRFADPLGLRAGLLLVPMGIVNEIHEPTTFMTTERPETERRIIPTTWRENGIGLFGDAAGLSYRAYLINGMDGVGGGSSKAKGFGASGLRDGRQKGSKAVAEDLAVVARLDFVGKPGLIVGASGYLGQSGQNNPPSSGTGSISARTVLTEGHVDWQFRGLSLRALGALAFVDDVVALNDVKQLTGVESIGERMYGWYVEASYDMLRSASTVHQLRPVARFEQVNTQSRVPQGFAADPANDVQVVTLGAAWKPITNLVFKADYQLRSNAANTETNQFNLAVGYVF